MLFIFFLYLRLSYVLHHELRCRYKCGWWCWCGGGGGSAAAAAIPKDESGVLQVADVPKYRIDDNPPNNPADSAGWYAA